MEVSETRLAVAITLVFLLGLMLSILNGYFIEDTGMQMPLLTYGVAAVAMMVGAMIILLFQWRISHQHAYNMLKVLPPDERKLIELLLKEKRMDQMHLVAESGLSKVKVSRLIMKLEQRGVVDKRPLGNTNLIRLKI
ncbi:MAG: hypothetical protein V1875_09660 [Candidatus Altiarchaeota archaeon]